MSRVLSEVQVLPASSVQQQFWLLQRLQPESSAYHVPSVFRVRGQLDIPALTSAFQMLLARHEILRTTFEERDGALFQCIAPSAELSIAVSRDDVLPSSEELQAEVAKPFELARGPLMRVRIWQTDGENSIMAWTLHHVVVDLASKDILSRELAALYAGHRLGTKVELEPARQYAEFSESEARFWSSDKAERAVEYFQQHLAGEIPPLALPEDHPRPLPTSHRGARVKFELTGMLGEALQRVAQERKTKPYLLLLTAFAAAMGRYSGTSRVVIGVPFINRRRAESQGSVGCCVNTLPVSVDLSGEPTFRELQDRVRQVMLGHHRNQEISLDRILGRVRPTRDASRNPLYQAGFTFEHPMELALCDAMVENLHVHAGGAQLDVFMTMWGAEDHWQGHLEYCADLFERTTAERLVRSYLALLEDALLNDAGEPKPAALLECMHPSEKLEVVAGFNRTAQDYGRHARMHELFLEQAAKTPDAIAVRSETLKLSYRDLQEYSQGLAHELRAVGVTDGDRVGIYMPRSVEMVVSVFAILLAGAAYVPIDPEFPQQRIGYVLEDANPRCVLGHSSLLGQWTNTSKPLRIVALEQITRTSEAPVTAVGPDAAAYVIFTSGSTGRPKGVAVSHRAICNSMLWMQSAFELGPDDVLIQTTPYSFDVSTWELLWVFIVGAQLEIPKEGVHRDPSALAQAIQQAGVTTIHFVPSMLQAFLEQTSIESCHSLRRVLCIGEALGSELVRRFHAACQIELHNLYGPTEAAVQASWWFCKPGLPTTTIPIGKPIANTQFYILDARLRPVPIGVAGELYIGGVQVAIEYVSRPDLTANAFVADPFASESGARMYRTGDLARWLADGNVAFLGRADFQVKIRGLRIELGEVEAVLDRHPLVAQCVVVARQVAGGSDAQLVAYIATADPSDSKQGDVLRSYAAEQLPSYMVPNRFVMLDKLPLNSNGKVDRKALPQLAAEVARNFTAPTTEVERWLSEQWGELLELNQVSINDSFFDAGGTSLMATRLMSRIRERFAVEIPLVRLFEYPTIARLSQYLGSLDEPSPPADDALLKAKLHAANRRAQAQRPVPRRGRG